MRIPASVMLSVLLLLALAFGSPATAVAAVPDFSGLDAGSFDGPIPAPGTLIVVNGFSCREQIEQGSGRATLHLAEVLALGLPPAGAPRPD